MNWMVINQWMHDSHCKRACFAETSHSARSTSGEVPRSDGPAPIILEKPAWPCRFPWNTYKYIYNCRILIQPGLGLDGTNSNANRTMRSMKDHKKAPMNYLMLYDLVSAPGETVRCRRVMFGEVILRVCRWYPLFKPYCYRQYNLI